MENKEENFLYRELGYKLIGLAMEVHNEYGAYHKERIYHRALQEKFDINKINYLSKPKIPVYSKETGKRMGYYEPDDLVEKKIVIELKAAPFPIRRDEIQLLQYLKITPYEIGYLINFGTRKLYYKRIIYTNDRKNLQ